MFGFIQDIGNYGERKVGRDDYDHGWISTARVSDGKQPYETAVKDDRYWRGDGKQEMVIAEAYNTREAAELGHAKWLALMSSKQPPASIDDCQNSEVSQLCDRDSFRQHIRQEQ